MRRANRWRWQRTRDEEPMTVVRVDHPVTRQDIANYLCASPYIETGTRLGNDAILEAAREYLLSAELKEPIEFWAENGYTDEEADARMKWAYEQADAFYERTSG